MGLELRRKPDGSLKSGVWYGSYVSGGRRRVVSLGVPVRGRVPDSLREESDTAFERSRATAQLKLEQFIAETHSKTTAQRHLEKLYEIKAGSAIGSMPLAKLPEAWAKADTPRKRSAMYEKNGKSVLRNLADHVTGKHPAVTRLAQVTPAMARDWIRSFEAKGLSARAINAKLALARSAFRILADEAGILANPFAGIPTKRGSTEHREPFTATELDAIVTAAAEVDAAGAGDPDHVPIRPILLTGIYTAMRQGDCCQLRWADVDLKAGFITVKTGKTGETAEIPLFPRLRAEIEAQRSRKGYVWPEAAAMYGQNRFGIIWRVKQVFKKAGIDGARAVEGHRRRVSVKDFHSLRTTWITMALSAGVPMELVRRVTGHATVDVVLKHYFRPGREEFRKALEAAMPRMLTAGDTAGEAQAADPVREAVAILEGMRAKSWKADRDRALAALKEAASG